MSDHESAPPDASDAASPMMTDPQSVEGLFVAALAKRSAEERETFLQEACGDDAERRRRVEALLRAYDDAGSFLEHPPLGTATADSFRLDFLTPSDDPGLLGLLGPYEVYEVLGRGGMGIVFRARDPKLNRVVAIKVLAPELAANPNARRRFLREAQAAAAISHPHVVTIHAVDEGAESGGPRAEGSRTSSALPSPLAALPYLVMECIVGQTLQQKLDKQGSLRLTETLRIGQQITCGLAAAHQQGLIHRDIKPANVLLENGVERVKITDFGLARLVDDVSITRTGEVSGTPQYMSPEQAQGDPVDHRSDLFSLGCVLYAMCTGRSPFRATSLAAAIRRVCDDTPRPIDEINPETPQWLIEIVNALLEKYPDDRIQTAEEVATLLSDRLAGIQRPLTSRKTSPERPASQSPPAAPPIPSDRRIGKGLVMAGAAFFVFPWLVAAGRTLMRIDDVGSRFGEELFGASILGLLAMLTGWTILTAFSRPSRTDSSPSPGTSRNAIGRLLIIGGSLLAGGVIVIFNYVVLRLPYQRPGQGQDFGATIVSISLVAASLLLIGLFLRRPSTGPARSTIRHRVGRAWNIRRIGRAAIWSGVALIALPWFPIAYGFLIQDGDPMEFGGRLVFLAAILGVLTIMMGCITLLVAYSVSQRHPEGNIGNRPWRDRVHQTAKSPWSVLGWMLVGGLVLIPGCLITMLAVPYLALSSSHHRSSPISESLLVDERGRIAFDAISGEIERITIDGEDVPFNQITDSRVETTTSAGHHNVAVYFQSGERYHLGVDIKAGQTSVFQVPFGGKGIVTVNIVDPSLSVELRPPNADGGPIAVVPESSSWLVTVIGESGRYLVPAGRYSVWITDHLAGWCIEGTEQPVPYSFTDCDVPSGAAATINVRRTLDVLVNHFGGWSDHRLYNFRWNDRVYTLTRPQAQAVHELFSAYAKDKPDVAEDEVLANVDPPWGGSGSAGANWIAKMPALLFDNGEHPAWGTLIIPGATEGTYRLAELETPPAPFNGIPFEQGGSVEPSDAATMGPPVGHDDSKFGPASPPAPPLPVDKEDAATVPDEEPMLFEQG